MSKSELDKFKLSYEYLNDDPIHNIKAYLKQRRVVRQVLRLAAKRK